MAPTPYSAVVGVLEKSGLEALAKSFLAAGGSQTMRQVVFQKYPGLPIGEKNYLVGLGNAYLSAGESQMALGGGGVLPQSAIPVNPGLGGVAGAVDRYRYLTEIERTSAFGKYQGTISVDVWSPTEMTSDQIAAAASAQVDAWAAKYPKLAKWLTDHPVVKDVVIIGVQRAF